MLQSIYISDPNIDELDITVLGDSYHAYVKLTCRSITRLIIMVGGNMVLFVSKKQGDIKTSMGGMEFCIM